MNNVRKMKKINLLAMVGIICAALIGCGGQENSTGGSTVNSEQDAEEFLEQLDEEYQASLEAEEEQHEAELEAEYPEGILPAGRYLLPEEAMQDDVEYIELRQIRAVFNTETKEAIVFDPGHAYSQTITDQAKDGYNYRYRVDSNICYTDEATDLNSDSYHYDPESGLYHFELYFQLEGEWACAEIIEGYYNAEDDSFTVTHYTHYTYYDGVLDPEKTITTEDGYEQVYYRE